MDFQKTRIVKRSRWASLALASVIAGFAPAVAAQTETESPRAIKVDVYRRTIMIDKGTSLRFPETWSVSGIEYRNAVELIAKGAKGTESAPEARTIITVERRLDHNEAVDRLGEIAGTRSGTVTYLSIGGWPAVQLRYRELLPEPAREERREGARQESRGIEERLALYTTTAIAVQDIVIRMHTTVAPKANQVRAREAEDIARKASLPVRNRPKQTVDELRRLRALKPLPGPERPQPPTGSVAPEALDASAKFRTQRAAASTAVAVGGSSETEAGVSTAGLNMIVASNGGTSISNNGGVTFTPTLATLPFPSQGDPSIAIGRSGNFYLALLGLLGQTSTTALTGCSASVISSGNNGAVFSFAGNAALCPATGTAMCFPDQEHISADRTNAASGGGDQLYAVWRNFGAFNVLGIGLPANCNGITSGGITPSLSCSADSGSSWSLPVAIGGGDSPRVSVGQDGFVYVVIKDGADVMVHKYRSCSNGLTELTGFPRRVISGLADTTCPLPGLDRCHSTLIAPTLAVDDTNPAHVYVGLARPGSAANDDILVIDSVDGGLNWRTPIIVNASVAARRFMPWICTAAGNAYVGWYDRRAAAAAGAASNDLTDFFLGGVTMRNGQLVRDGERNLTGTADAQCASGWRRALGAPMEVNDSERCTVQPQLAGSCQNSSSTGSNTPCDFSSGPSCPSGERCLTGSGGPKYGDYNGIACGPDRVLATWASATAPVGFMGTPPTGIRVFAEVAMVNGSLTVVKTSIPANDPGRFNVLVDGTVVSSAISNAVVGPIALPVTVPHRISQTTAAGTSSSNYSVSISGDCDSDGLVHFSALRPATCKITSVSRAYQGCVSECAVSEGQCMLEARSVVERQQCVQDRLACTDNCSRARLTVLKRVVPSIDAGRFNLMIDGIVHKTGAGDGGSTTEVALGPGVHTVSESAVGATSLSNYTTTFGGDCSPTGEVSLQLGEEKICEITNTRKPGTSANAFLTIKKILIPATDPGRFNLQIDGVTRATNVGDSGSTGPIVVLQGTHTVSESGNGTSLSSYIRTFSGDCNAAGVVTLSAGDNKTCTITNRKNIGSCTAVCNISESECMLQAHGFAERQKCVQEKVLCVRDCSRP